MSAVYDDGEDVGADADVDSDADTKWKNEFDAGHPVLGNRVVTPDTEQARKMASFFVNGEFKQDLRALFFVQEDRNAGDQIFISINDVNYPPFSVATSVPVQSVLSLKGDEKVALGAIGATRMPWDKCPSRMGATLHAGGRVVIRDASNPHVYFDLTIPKKYLPVTPLLSATRTPLCPSPLYF